MADSPKIHSVRTEDENHPHTGAMPWCMQDELCIQVSSPSMSFSEGSTSGSSNEAANTQVLRSPYRVQDIRSTRSSSALELDSSWINPAGWDSCRRPLSLHSTSGFSHADYLSLVRNLASGDTVTHTPDSLAQTTIDHLSFPNFNQSLESIPYFSILARQPEGPIQRGSQLPSTLVSEEQLEDHTHVLTHESVSTLQAGGEQRTHVNFNVNGTISDRGFTSDPECYSRTGYPLRRARRHIPQAYRSRQPQAPPIPEGATRIRTPTHSSSASAILRSSLSPGISRLSRPPALVDAFFIHEPEDYENLPALLSPTDGSDSDCPPSLGSSSRDTDTDSQILSGDERSSHFLNPGTPIQTQLPELQSLLEMIPTQESGGDSRRLWMAPDGSIAAPDQVDFQMSPDDDDITGDIERANELLDGLEQVNAVLVRRYEKVRGEGHDICAVCRDALLPPEDIKGTDVSDLSSDSSMIAWSGDVLTSHALPFKAPTPHEQPRIHAFPCTHLFHTSCLLPWLSLKTTCPTCRLDIDPLSLTLRVREWGTSASSTWPYVGALNLEQRREERQYVNVDALGRRIPWKAPCALSLQEWVERRENETPEERVQRLKLCPSPCGIELLQENGEENMNREPTPVSRRRRTVSEPRTMIDMCRDTHTGTHIVTPLEMVICQSSELRDIGTDRVGLWSRSRSLTGRPREDNAFERSATQVRSGDYVGHNPTARAVEESVYSGSYAESEVSIPHTTAGVGLLGSEVIAPRSMSG